MDKKNAAEEPEVKKTDKTSTAKKQTAAAKKSTGKKEEVKASEVDLNSPDKGIVRDYEETKTFIFMDDVKRILDVSLATGKNCILHGKGGYGKSEYTYGYLREQGIKPYVITMGSGMTTDRLFGGVDLKKFQKTGKIEYLIENSFMNHEFVIFEELFDAPDFILEQLKDILSSGIFRNGGQVFPIRTRSIFCCTNKTREEFAKNLSLRALMERFPLELEVGWKEHNRLTYQKLLETKFGPGTADPMLTYILEQFAKKGNKISPRIALTAAGVVNDCGPECLEFIADFKDKDGTLKDAISKFKNLAKANEDVEVIQELIKGITEIVKKGLNDKSEVKEASELNKKLKTKVDALSKVKLDDSMAVDIGKKVKNFKEIHTKFDKTITITETVGDIEDLVG